jgi:transcriptional regulator of met regulon
MSHKVLVTLTDEQYNRLQSEETLGATDSERLRNAFLIYHNLRDVLDVIRKLK